VSSRQVVTLAVLSVSAALAAALTLAVTHRALDPFRSIVMDPSTGAVMSTHNGFMYIYPPVVNFVVAAGITASVTALLGLGWMNPHWVLMALRNRGRGESS
jgi:hypothetical protein